MLWHKDPVTGEHYTTVPSKIADEYLKFKGTIVKLTNIVKGTEKCESKNGVYQFQDTFTLSHDLGEVIDVYPQINSTWTFKFKYVFHLYRCKLHYYRDHEVYIHDSTKIEFASGNDIDECELMDAVISAKEFDEHWKIIQFINGTDGEDLYKRMNTHSELYIK